MEKKVQVPAIGLIVLGILGVLASLWGMVQGSVELQDLLDAGMPQEQAEKIVDLMNTGGTAVRWIMSLIGIGAGAFIAWAGFQMLKLRSWTACVVANILVMVPCITSCCCLLGIPIGIWGLVVLFNQDVKRAFESGGGAPPPAFTT